MISYNHSCIKTFRTHKLRTNAAPYHLLSSSFSDVHGVQAVWRRCYMDVYIQRWRNDHMGKSKYWEKSLSQNHFSHHKPPTQSAMEANPGLRVHKPAINSLSYDTASYGPLQSRWHFRNTPVGCWMFTRFSSVVTFRDIPPGHWVIWSWLFETTYWSHFKGR
jgi:hypothetical protein